MKKGNFLILILVTGLLLVSKLEAQSVHPKLNQNELMKKFVGSWYTEGTNLSGEIRQFGTDGLEGYQKAELKDSVLLYYQFIFGYDKTNDRYIAAGISKTENEIILMAYKFISENICERAPVEYLNKGDQSAKAMFEFKSPDLIIGTFKDQNKPDRVYRMIRGKKPV